ncbi:MAG TPA: ABC transporter substrate-binding protein [Stellaceae bacterium]|jgi:branched-chain amino acid transport system substrate-binding protein
MRKTSLYLGAAVLLLTATAGVAVAADVKVGAIEDLSGPTAKYGVAIRQGFDLAADEINGMGGSKAGKFDIIYEDAAGQKEQALNAARKLLARDKVVTLLGPTLSTESFAAAPAANERKIPIIGTSTTANGITDIGEWVFRTAMPEADVIPVALQKAQKKFGIKKVALLYANDDAVSKTGADVMKAALPKLGIEIAAEETFATKDTDFSAQLTKVKGLGVDALCVSSLAEAGAGVVLQARQLGIPKTVPIIAGNGFNSPKIAEIAGDSSENVIVGSPWFVGKKDPANEKFVAAFRKKYNQDPDQFAAQAYDTLYILKEAIDRADSTENTKLHDALLKTDHTGVLGPFRFTPHRDPGATEGVVVLVIKNGKFTELE